MKKTFLFRSCCAVLTFVLVMFSTFALHAQRASFTGDWKLNEAKSELGEFGGRVARSIKAEQKEDALATTRVSPGFNGGDSVTTTVKLTFDGKVTESEGFAGSKRKSTAKWSDDGKTLTVSSTMNFERDGQSFEIKSTEIWTITKDGLLSVVTNSTSPRGESTTKAIYTR
ncbi:MAG: hypothetical protein ABIQ88_01455 [Chitinophagaceae bacterium]